MAKPSLLLACLLSATLAVPLAAAEPIRVDARSLVDPDVTAAVLGEPVVGGFCVLSAACVEAFCVQRLSFCCPRVPDKIDPHVIQCTRP